MGLKKGIKWLFKEGLKISAGPIGSIVEGLHAFLSDDSKCSESNTLQQSLLIRDTSKQEFHIKMHERESVFKVLLKSTLKGVSLINKLTDEIAEKNFRRNMEQELGRELIEFGNDNDHLVQLNHLYGPKDPRTIEFHNIMKAKYDEIDDWRERQDDAYRKKAKELGMDWDELVSEYEDILRKQIK